MSSRLAALTAEVAALRERVSLLEHQAGVRVDDDRALMRALVSSAGRDVFSAADLVAHATVDRALRVALQRYPTVQQVGTRLRGLANKPIAGFVLQRVTRDEHGTIWALHVADDLHGERCAGEDAAG